MITSYTTDMPAASAPKSKLCLSDTTKWMIFKDPAKQKEYECFRGRNTNIWVLVAITIIMTIGNFIMSLMLVSSSITHDGAPMYTNIFRLVRALCVLPAWVLIYCLSFGNRPGIHSVIRSYLPSDTFLGNSCLLCYFIGMCLLNIVRVLAGQCSTDHYLHSKNCNPEASVNGLPQDTTIMCILGLVVLQIVVKSHQWWAIAVSWAMVTGTLFALVVHINSNMSSVLVMVSFLLVFVLYDHEKQILDTFLALENLEVTIREVLVSENAKVVLEMQTAEMRNLIGNVAHDLKTPMQAFMLELEHLETIITRTYKQTSDSVIMTRHELSVCFDALQNLNDTCAFMYMLMNRAIDFTKSSAGFKLVPSLETVNFPMSIKWALNLIKTKHSAVSISLAPISADIATHIITDKQWLIENIICLVSNAAKFTLNGSVTVTCKLDKALSRRPHLHVDVEDTGIGINPEMRRILFQPFQQAMRMAGGTGLGLYSLSKRVEAIGGTYGVADRYDGANGTRFWFTLPYNPDDGECSRGGNYVVHDTVKSFRFRGVENLSPEVVVDIENQHKVEPLTPRKSPRVQSLLCSVLLLERSPNPALADRLVSQGTRVERCSTLQDTINKMSNCAANVLLIEEEFLTAVIYEREQRHQEACWNNVVIIVIAQSKDSIPKEDGFGSVTPDVTASELFSLFCVLRNKYIPPDKNAFNICDSPCPTSTVVPLAASQSSIDLCVGEDRNIQLSALVVDDSVPIQKSVKKCLENEGFIVDVAENGAVALEKLRLNHYTLTLMDLQMPVMDGLECVSRFRKYEAEFLTTRQVIFGMTAYTQEDINWSPREAGMDGFIAKPFRAAKLLEMCKIAGILL